MITLCVINARCSRRWLGGGKESDYTMRNQCGCLGRWLGGGREGDYTMCNQWRVLEKVVRWG